MSVDKILNKLDKVKKTGQGKWMCKCPVHPDKTASLAISDIGDGRILVNCFAGCDTYSILQSIGLDWADLMPENANSQREKPVKQIIYATDALRLIKFETQIILYIAYEMRKKGSPDADGLDRLEKSMQLIHKACEAANVE